MVWQRKHAQCLSGPHMQTTRLRRYLRPQAGGFVMPNFLNLAGWESTSVLRFQRRDFMRRPMQLLLLMLAVCVVTTPVLGLALIGWMFFLGLLGGAILHIVKKARKPYTPKNPVKCK